MRCKYDGCSGLTSVSIPNSVTSIGNYAFENCNAVIICNNKVPPSASNTSFKENSVAIVPKDAVEAYKKAKGWSRLRINCSIIKEILTPITVTLITSELFSDTYVIFDGNKYYPKNDTITITNLTQGKTYTYESYGKYKDIEFGGTDSFSTPAVSLSLTAPSKTNTTLSVRGSHNFNAADVAESGIEGYSKTNTATVEGLSPGKTYYLTYYVVAKDGSKFTKTASFTTIAPSITISANAGVSSCTLSGDWSVIDATVVDYGFEDYNNQKTVHITGLDPNTTYTRTFYVDTKDGSRTTQSFTFTTERLELTTSQPKVVSLGNVIVAAQANLDEEEANVGFEWRRTDWSDDFASNTGGAYIYNGTIEGYIRNLNTEKLWKYRPYYLSNSGTYYYGDWVGLDPTNTSYFEPTVHTYASINIEGNTALVKGYALTGTDKIKVQGFKYWRSVATAGASGFGKSLVASIPGDAKTVEASGQVMTANITGLDYNATYHYVAFATTSEGDTYYGEEQVFTTGEDPAGIEDFFAEPVDGGSATVVAIYNLAGQHLETMQQGINILRTSDGSAKKVYVK